MVGDRSGDTVEPTRFAGNPSHTRLRMLDGWRALSILLVLAGHMFPLGLKAWGLNGQVPALGMAIFFFLSGFLIVSILQRDPDIVSFLIRRLARIVPLGWLALLLSFSTRAIAAPVWLANFLFYANIPPFWLDDQASHYWSLCLEMQFYVTIALAVGLLGRRGLWLVPIGLVAVTIVRLETGTLISIVSWLRADEILAGGTCALFLHQRPETRRAPAEACTVLADGDPVRALGQHDLPIPRLRAALRGRPADRANDRQAGVAGHPAAGVERRALHRVGFLRRVHHPPFHDVRLAQCR